jgi:hypothetical protein
MTNSDKVTVEFPTATGTIPVQMTKHQGQTVNLERSNKAMAEAREKASWERIGTTTESFNSMHQAYASDYGLTPEELAAAVYLENLNMREFFPEDLGGKQGYDTLCKAVWEWFEEQKKKA